MTRPIPPASTTPTTIATAPAALQPLSPQHLQELAQAQASFSRIRNAVRWATFDAWTVASFAALTLVCGLFDASGFPLGIGLGVVAYIEFRAARRLRQLDPAAPRVLAINQLALMGILILYFAFQIYGAYTGDSVQRLLRQAAPEMAPMLEQDLATYRMMVVAFYLILIAAVVAAQGGTALYYASRARHLRDYIARTPAWVRDMQTAGITIV